MSKGRRRTLDAEPLDESPEAPSIEPERSDLVARIEEARSEDISDRAKRLRVARLREAAGLPPRGRGRPRTR